MIEDTFKRADVDRFILDRIDSIPQLEALLLLFQEPSEFWTVKRVAKGLWIHAEDASGILQALTRDQLVVRAGGHADSYRYQRSPDKDRLLHAIAESYRADMVRISRMIHAKPSSRRHFLRSFLMTDEEE